MGFYKPHLLDLNNYKVLMSLIPKIFLVAHRAFPGIEYFFRV